MAIAGVNFYFLRGQIQLFRESEYKFTYLQYSLKESESNCLLIGGSGRNSLHSFAPSLLHSSSKKSTIKQAL